VPEALSVGLPGIATYPRGEMNSWSQEVWRRTLRPQPRRTFAAVWEPTVPFTYSRLIVVLRAYVNSSRSLLPS
jgi:hypothetical protein